MGASRLPVGDEPMAFKNVEDVLSYREENDQVVLTMSREDYESLLLWLGMAHGSQARSAADWDRILKL